jgi:8-amino-7-oxononanoate synthase
MDGDVGPLAALARISRSHEAWLVVDDAHGLGVIGATGRGAVEHFGLDAEAVPVLVGTLGKAFGSFGAFVAGSGELIELLMQRARSYIYTTALPQPVAAASRKALEIAQRETWRRERVLALAARFRRGAEQMGVPLMGTDAIAGRVEVQPLTPIQPVVLGSSEAALRAQRALFAAGFCVVAIRPPTVPQGSARLRVTLSAAHTETQVDELVEMLSRACAAPDMVS